MEPLLKHFRAPYRLHQRLKRFRHRDVLVDPLRAREEVAQTAGLTTTVMAPTGCPRDNPASGESTLAQASRFGAGLRDPGRCVSCAPLRTRTSLGVFEVDNCPATVRGLPIPQGRQMRTQVGLLVVAMLFAAVAASAARLTAHARHVSPGCSDNSPCHLGAGTHQLGAGSVFPGLRITVSRGWSSHENNAGEFNLVAARSYPDDRLKLWRDMVAVKSSGHGHGTTILANVGKRPKDLIAWLSHNPDFQILSGPTGTRIAHGFPATTIAFDVSRGANYGDPGCPSNPRCADVFTNPKTWTPGNWVGIGGREALRLYFAAITRKGREHTFIVALDAPKQQLQRFTLIARPIITALRFPAGTAKG